MLTVTDLSKTYRTEERTQQAVREVNFATRKGEFYTLLGPSGCGKSTTLRCIAGLEKPEHGEIRIGHEVVFSGARGIFVPSYKRNLGMVFQSYAIWPHMTVFDNVAFPLVSGERKLSKEQVRERVTSALSLVKLDGLASQPAPLLSGGQQQRVALARALAHQPEVLLLDEPLSNLDAKLREEMRVQIRILTRRLNVTTIYVTHDQLEALQMSDRIAVMHDGRIVEEGTPKQIYLSPRTAYTAGFVGRVNFFEGLVRTSQSQDNMARVETSIGVLTCHVPEGSDYGGGEKVLVAVRPEGISISMERPQEGANVIRGVLEASMFAGDTQDCIVQVNHHEIQVKADPLTDLPANASVYLHLPPARCVIIRGLAG